MAPTVSTGVQITGVGAVSCLGPDVDSLWRAVRANHSAIKDGLGQIPPEFLTVSLRELDGNRALGFAVQAIDEAKSQAGWNGPLGEHDGLILATTTGQLLQWDVGFIEFINERSTREEFRRVFRNQPLGALLDSIGRHYQVRGPTSLLTSACSASTQALALGAMWIRQKRVTRCLVVGVEVLCDLTCQGFRSLQLLSNQPSTPFDDARQGINLSEGGAALCLEVGPVRAGTLAQISGFGFSTDGFHMTGPHPQGEGSRRAMQHALKIAGLSPREITWVHAHGTGSLQNDLSEGLAIAGVFGRETPWVSSSKWSHGHALGASGALESALVVKAMGENIILHTRGLHKPDAAIPIRHPHQDLVQPIRHVVKNTLGFGGTNAAIVLSHPEAT